MPYSTVTSFCLATERRAIGMDSHQPLKFTAYFSALFQMQQKGRQIDFKRLALHLLMIPN